MKALFAAAALAWTASADTSDIDRSFDQICIENGFNVEQHTVTTEDGFVLKMFRIPGKIDQPQGSKGPLYLQHGLLDSSDAWIMHTVDKAPAFVAAAAGYDVWLGNSRGNKYSRNNIKLSPDDKAFWDYDFQTMGDYDLPTQIEYVRKMTGYAKIAYAGHSQGTSQLFYRLAKDEQWFEDRLSVAMAFGPVMAMRHDHSKLLDLLSDSSDLV